MQNLKHFNTGQSSRQPTGFVTVTKFAIDGSDTDALGIRRETMILGYADGMSIWYSPVANSNLDVLT